MTDHEFRPIEGDKRVKIVTSTITEEWSHYCRRGPGCTSASPDGPCCGAGYWRQIGSAAEEFIPASLYQRRSSEGRDGR